MAKLMKIRWWQWFPFFPWRIVATVESADEIPQQLPRNGAVLVKSGSHRKWVAFDCPCRSGHRIMLNTDSNRWPFWFTTVRGRLTIAPSVDYRYEGQHCHYLIQKGRIRWVK